MRTSDINILVDADADAAFRDHIMLIQIWVSATQLLVTKMRDGDPVHHPSSNHFANPPPLESSKS